MRNFAVSGRKGSIGRGKDADLTVANDDFELQVVFCRGVQTGCDI